MHVPILRFLQKIPGGILLVPLLIMAAINTLVPEWLQIGDPTTALFTGSGTMVMVGMILFIAGCHLNLSSIGRVALFGGVMLATKLLLGAIVSIIMLNTCGPNGILGISVVAITVALVSGNEGMYISLVNQYGNDNDIAAVGIMNLVTIPAVPIAVLCVSAGAQINWLALWAGFVPFLLGCVLSNLDRRFGELMEKAMNPALFFIGGMFGSNINLVDMLSAGLSGILLAILFLLISIPVFFVIDRFLLRGKGYAGPSFCCVAGMTVILPSLVAIELPDYAVYVVAATSQLTMAILITTIVTPFIVRAIVSKYGDGKRESSLVISDQ